VAQLKKQRWISISLVALFLGAAAQGCSDGYERVSGAGFATATSYLISASGDIVVTESEAEDSSERKGSCFVECMEVACGESGCRQHPDKSEHCVVCGPCKAE
jgi:hypothetical protein